MNERTSPGATELTLADVLRFLKRRWVVIGVSGAAVGLLAAVYLGLMVEDVYESSALIAVSPTVLTQRLPSSQGIDVRDYLELAVSDGLLGEVESGLLEQEVLAEGDSLNPGVNVHYKLQPRGQNDVGTVFRLTARGENPEQAAAIANRWAETFLDTAADVQRDQFARLLAPIRAQLTEASEGISASLARRAEMVREDNARYEQVQNEWQQKLAEVEHQLAQRSAAFYEETRNLFNELVTAALTSLTPSAGDTATGPTADSTPDYRARTLRQGLFEVTDLRTQLAQTPDRVVLSTAIGAEAIADSVLLTSDPSQVGPVEGLFRTEQINAERSNLWDRLLDTEARVRRVAGSQIGQVNELLQRLAKLQEQRSAEHAVMRRSHELEQLRVSRAKDQAWQEYVADRQIEQDAVARALDEHKRVYEQQVSDHSKLAPAVAAGDLGELRLLSAADPVHLPLDQRRALKIAVALVLGLILGLGVAVVIEVG